jgi:type I restriction enzyme R subunit
MPTSNVLSDNFAHLQLCDEQLARLGTLAERYLVDDPNTSLIKMRQFGELLAKHVASKVGKYRTDIQESQYQLLQRLRDEGVLSYDLYRSFGEVRIRGNDATHSLDGDPKVALNVLKFGWQIGVWFHKTFIDSTFQPNTFVEAAFSLSGGQVAHAIREESAAYGVPHDEKELRDHLEQEVIRAQSSVEESLAKQQARAESQQPKVIAKYKLAANAATNLLILDEPQTRQIIDTQLREAGWEADTQRLRYERGARPQKGRNLAIAEWPTASGPADYVLFVGLMPIAVVEAKRKNRDVSAALQQAKRYSHDFAMPKDMQSPGGPWDVYKIPFVFSTNARNYLKQLEMQSGIWFCDLRHSENLSRPLDGWYTPEGLMTLLKSDEAKANAQLTTESFDYGFALRYYQKDAIRSAEKGIAEGRREMLLAMATGTGKTKTCIALIYRLLKVKRFRRVLFLVDRSALGEQAANAFKDTRMDSIQSFADIFGIKELDEPAPETETAVHIATIQGMVKRLLYAGEDQSSPSVDQYDCIVVDECHRGYLLDRELSDQEISFRSFEDYVSKYRRVIDYFDAVKIGLTATPALHTVDIFGTPIYTYSYREAVVDGFLIDHEPPVQIKTKLSEAGIKWKSGEEVQLYYPRSNQMEMFKAPDEIKMDVEAFNKKVMTRAFNRVVCEYLAKEIDPEARQKTLIFCANDIHADLVVDLLKKEFQKRYGNVQDDAVIKVTGNADKPLELIRRYKNERNPTVAVTVDLLTTGIDVPEICNLVFLRRVNSRILFDQMLGRATRLCEEIEKETFRVFDAVGLYNALKDLTEMQPVVVDPKVSFGQLVDEIIRVKDEAERELVRDQLAAKFQRKKRHLSETSKRDFETIAGVSVDEFVKKLRSMPLHDVAEWFIDNQRLGEILDRQEKNQTPMLVSLHADEVVSVEHGYGYGKKPQDYLDAFKEYIQKNRDTIPALITVLTRPRDLTRKQLRELAIELDLAGFSEAKITTAWRDMTTHEIAAHIVGFIRHLATGDPLVPYEQRVQWALEQMLSARSWSTPQKQWLQKIAAQTKANIVVDRDALDDPDLIFHREGGGFTRLDRIFDGQLENTLEQFHDLVWKREEDSLQQ